MRRGAAERLTLGDFVTLPSLNIQTILKASHLPEGFRPLMKGRDPSTNKEATANAVAAGICHVASARTVTNFGFHYFGAFRILNAGVTSAIEVAFIADLDNDLHVSGPSCFESYEISGSFELITPDLIIQEEKSSRLLICGFSWQESLIDYVSSVRGEVRIVASCSSAPGRASQADYLLSRINGPSSPSV